MVSVIQGGATMKNICIRIAAILACALVAYGQTRAPVDALEEMATTDKFEDVMKHLPTKLDRFLNALPPEKRTRATELLLLRERMKREGITLQKNDDGSGWAILRGDERKGTIAVRSTLISGPDALIELEINEQRRSDSMLISMRLEEGEWRVERIGEWRSKALEPLDLYREVTDGYDHPAASLLNMLNIALLSYCAEYPEAGFPSDLATLSGQEGTQASREHAMLLDPSYVSTPIVKDGYEIRYTLLESGRECRGKYRITATPAEPRSADAKRFFTDQTGVVRVTTEPREANEKDKALP
jgi:hypothetical protein